MYDGALVVVGNGVNLVKLRRPITNGENSAFSEGNPDTHQMVFPAYSLFERRPQLTADGSTESEHREVTTEIPVWTTIYNSHGFWPCTVGVGYETYDRVWGTAKISIKLFNKERIFVHERTLNFYISE